MQGSATRSGNKSREGNPVLQLSCQAMAPRGHRGVERRAAPKPVH
jgi:hypothetical protein